eukprot:4665334-Ditylum_brightwellii.AAC.1
MRLHRIAEFSGEMEDWKERNNGTQCVIDGSGWGRSLSDREYSDRRRNQNKKIFHSMSFANSREMA